MVIYTLHPITLRPDSDPQFVAMDADGDIGTLQGAEELRALYDCLHAYFAHGIIAGQPVEWQVMSSAWRSLSQAAVMAVGRGAPDEQTFEEIEARIRRAAELGRIKGATRTQDGAGWWFPRHALDEYLFRCTWKDRQPIPPSAHPTIFLPEDARLIDDLDQGWPYAHEQDGILYNLYLDSEDRIVGVVDEESLKRREEQAARREELKKNRVKVMAGHYSKGDMLDGRQILGLGVVWTEGTLRAGQLYQPCRRADCEREPACVNCECCARHCSCDVEQYQYVYFTERPN